MQMTNNEALSILREELWFRKNMLPTSPLLEEQGEDLLTQAIEVAIEALELCVMIEDDGR